MSDKAWRKLQNGQLVSAEMKKRTMSTTKYSDEYFSKYFSNCILLGCDTFVKATGNFGWILVAMDR